MNTNCFYLVLMLCLTAVLSDSDTTSENEDNLDNITMVPVEDHQNVSVTNHDKRIRGGKTIDITQAKYYVFILCGGIQCGGTLVRRNKVITAGHCVDSCKVNQFEMAVGLNAVSEYGRARKYRANSIRLHPKYSKQNMFPYDVAVITLTQNVDLNNRVGLINYANSIPPVRGLLTVVGYGLLNTNGQRATRLQSAQVRIVQRQRTQMYTEVVGASGPSVLPGDSGGPAVFNNRLAGITSAIQLNQNVVVRNVFVAVGNPEILSFICRYAP